MWGITSSITGAIRKAPLALLQGIEDCFMVPPEKIEAFWESLSPDDQQLFKEAALALARIGARAAIDYAKKAR